MSAFEDILKFKLFEGKGLLHDIGRDPSRLLTGVDPASTAAWNGVLGTHNKPLVDQWGGTTGYRMDAADKAGINTGPGRAMEGLAHVIASYYAGRGLAGVNGAAPSATNATNPALSESAVNSPGYGASSAGAGANAYSASPMASMGNFPLPSQQQQQAQPLNLTQVGDPHAQQQKEQLLLAMLARQQGGPYG